LPYEKQGKVLLEPDVHQHLYCWNFRTINNLLYRVGFSVNSNKFYYRNTGLKKLSFFGKYNLKFYYYVTLFIGMIFGFKELFILAEK
jgi:hypothetical protein